MKPKTIRPTVQLSGGDGNVFDIIGKVSKALKRAGLPEQAEEFKVKVTAARNYDEVLQLAMTYCEVE